MAHNFKQASLTVDAAVNAVTALLDGGFLDIYEGAQPDSPEEAPVTQRRLARLNFGAPAFARSRGGLAVATAIETDHDAAASGTATWFRARKADGSAVFDGSVGTTEADLILDAVTISEHADVACSLMTYALARG